MAQRIVDALCAIIQKIAFEDDSLSQGDTIFK